MNDMEFTFSPAAWQLALDRMSAGSTMPAMRLLTLLEGEEDDAVSDAFEAMEEKRITLDISELPGDPGCGQTAQRLAHEALLVREGDLLRDLEENDPLRLYLEEIASVPAAGDPQLLAERCAAGEKDLVSQLLNVSVGMAIARAKELTGRGVLLMDLIQEANLGLWQSILQYTEGDFTAQANWWIGQYLAQAVFLQARESGVGERMRRILEQYREADRRLLVDLGRNPTREEIALEIGITPEAAEVYEDMLRSAQEMERIKEPPKDDPVEEERAVEDTAYFQSRQRVQELLSLLTEEEAKVLALRFGLEGGTPLSPQEVGSKLNLTSDRVLEIEAAALQKMRTQE